MLYFVIPLRDAGTTANWRRVCLLLERTLASAAGQAQGRWRILLLCHTRPEGISLPQGCEVLPMSFAPPAITPQDDRDRRLWLMHTDKGRKLLHGLAVARADAGSYVMFLDADDLVSCRLAQHVETHTGAPGWYMETGYRMDERFRHFVYWRRSFYHECGSSYIIRSDLAPCPERLDDTLDLSDYYVRRYVVHAYVKDDLAKRGTPLAPLPFRGAIYTFNGENFYAGEHRRPDRLWRTVARGLLKGRWITRRLRAEFGIRPLPTLGAAND